MHNIKYLFISFVILLIALGGINFYVKGYTSQMQISEGLYKFYIFFIDEFRYIHLQLFHIWKSNFLFDESSYLDERLTNLEIAKFSLSLILFLTFFFGFLATIATYAINVWTVRSVTRSLVGKEIEKFNIRMRLELENRTTPIDKRLISLDNKFSSFENSITQGAFKMNLITDSSKKELRKIYKHEKKKINKDLKKKQLHTNFINFMRR